MITSAEVYYSVMLVILLVIQSNLLVIQIHLLVRKSNLLVSNTRHLK